MPIDSIYAWVGDDPSAPGGQGIVGAPLPGLGTSIPLVAGNIKTARMLKPFAEIATSLLGRGCQLVRFDRREVIERIAPRDERTWTGGGS